jgi:hypothetical protein
MTTTALTTELEALNLMLTAADEDPVQTATQAGHLPLSIAKGVLNDFSRVVQSLGWAFNTERDFPLPRDVTGRVTLSPNTLSADVNDIYSDIDPIQRGLSLYDKKNHTPIFTKDLLATVILLLPWDELPQAVRYYISIRASRVFQVRMQAGEGVFKYSEQDEFAALVALQSFEADTGDANFLTDSYSCAGVLLYREN